MIYKEPFAGPIMKRKVKLTENRKKKKKKKKSAQLIFDLGSDREKKIISRSRSPQNLEFSHCICGLHDFFKSHSVPQLFVVLVLRTSSRSDAKCG